MFQTRGLLRGLYGNHLDLQVSTAIPGPVGLSYQNWDALNPCPAPRGLLFFVVWVVPVGSSATPVVWAASKEGCDAWLSEDTYVFRDTSSGTAPLPRVFK